MNQTLLARTARFLLIAFMAGAFPLLAQSPVAIEKATNGQDADSPPGPVVTVGSTLTWTYVVTNTGGRDLTDVVVTDDQLGTIACPSSVLSAGTSMTCSANGTAVAGQYANVGTVTANEVGGGPATDSDPSHYFGQLGAAVSLVKSTNGVDANVPPGPVVAVGSAINWTYLVTNLSGDPLTSVAVSDDRGVTVTCPGTTLAAGASMTCTASGIAESGQYANIGAVVATHPTLGLVAASDPSHYFGQADAFDFGDAPDSYGTSFAADGARHLLGSGIYLGSCVDAEIDGPPSSAADADDLTAGTETGVCATPGDDEDGVTFGAPLTAGQPALATVGASAPCTLSAWIDFDAGGTFGSSEALFPGGVILAAGPNPVAFPVPPAAADGTAQARFRCTTEGTIGPIGGARDGEVEDYQVTIATSADLSVAKGDSPDPVTPGATLTYSMTVNNAGPSNAATVSLSDALPAGTTFVSLTAPAGWTCTTPAVGSAGSISCSTASLAPGSAMFSLAVTVDPALAGGVTISNTATVSSATSDPVAPNNSATALTLVGPPQTDIQVTKNDAPDPVTPGNNLTYSIQVINAGPSQAATVTLSDALPAGTTFVSLTAAAGWSCTTPAAGSTGTMTCSTAVMAAGSASFSLVVAVDPTVAGGTILSNTATVASATADPVASNNNATIGTAVGAAQADLAITKSDAPDPVTPETPLTYSMIVSNAGPSDAANVTLSDAVASSTTFVSLAAPAGWTCTTPAAGSSGTISCSIGLLPSGSNASFTLVVNVGASAVEGSTITNTATVASVTFDPVAGNETATAATLVGPHQADLSLTKSDSPDPVTSGAHLTYSLTVANTGPNPATTLQMNDPLPPETTFVSLTAPAGWTCLTPAAGSGGTIACSAPSLGSGSTASFTLTVAVAAGLPAGTTLSNTATIASATVDPNPSNNSGTTTTAVQTAAIPLLGSAGLLALLMFLAIIAVAALPGRAF